MSPKRFVFGLLVKLAGEIQKAWVLRSPGPKNFSRKDWSRSLDQPREFYFDCFRYFHRYLPAELRKHRAYFSQNLRGFGEDAMHAQWFLLFHELKPKSFLEIGVYRGQIISLISLLSKSSKMDCFVQGISPFSPIADSVSKYPANLDYYQDTLANFCQLALSPPNLLKALSTDEEAVAKIRSQKWDLIYIDGNHDYEIVCRDWQVCSASIRPGGVIVLDDSSLNTNYRPPMFGTAGHPGPSRLAAEIDPKSFREILRVGHNRAFQKNG